MTIVWALLNGLSKLLDNSVVCLNRYIILDILYDFGMRLKINLRKPKSISFDQFLKLKLKRKCNSPNS